MPRLRPSVCPHESVNVQSKAVTHICVRVGIDPLAPWMWIASNDPRRDPTLVPEWSVHCQSCGAKETGTDRRVKWPKWCLAAFKAAAAILGDAAHVPRPPVQAAPEEPADGQQAEGPEL